MQLTEQQLVLARTQVDELHDAVYVLACAVEDAEKDLEAAGPKATAGELREILNWLIENSRPLTNVKLRPQ